MTDPLLDIYGNPTQEGVGHGQRDPREPKGTLAPTREDMQALLEEQSRLIASLSARLDRYIEREGHVTNLYEFVPDGPHEGIVLVPGRDKPSNPEPDPITHGPGGPKFGGEF